ncbi:hypothetical protein ACIQV2_24485 [Streptomyces globosus]|uniref:hypothetical protein n=1 Tax=Streptomyces TaxID=1883 RepID=UPI0021B07543|nr:hypothetical protein [Streptomyces sp. WAC05292]
MSHPLPALAVAVLCASGCVWYVPALADVRAGADRPASRRAAALACLTGWGTAALAVPLLLTPAPWVLLAALAGTGAGASAALLLHGRIRHGAEQREAARRWADLGCTGPSAVRPARARVAWALAAATAAPAAAAALLLAGGR